MFNIPFQLILSIANRCRGGLVKILSGQLARLVLWAVPAAVVIFFTKHLSFDWNDLYYFLGLVVFLFIGEACAAWGKYDTFPNNWNWGMLTVQGIIFTWPTALVACFASYKMAALLALSGLLIAPCYRLAWMIPSKIKGLETGPPLGELFFGFVIGLLISFS